VTRPALFVVFVKRHLDHSLRALMHVFSLLIGGGARSHLGPEDSEENSKRKTHKPRAVWDWPLRWQTRMFVSLGLGRWSLAIALIDRERRAILNE
jgi:hypothetical protein